MSYCQQDLRLAGKAYPRTCADCGLGPCKKYVPTSQPESTAGLWFDGYVEANGLGNHFVRIEGFGTINLTPPWPPVGYRVEVLVLPTDQEPTL